MNNKQMDKCPHKDISGWIQIDDKVYIKICLDCNKEIERMEVE